MEKIIWFWNLVHYNVFIWRNKMSNFLLYPFLRILRTSIVRNLYNKRGVSEPDLIVKDAILNPVNGSNSIRSGGTMGMLLLLICASFFLIYTGIFETEINTNPIQILVYSLIIIPLNYYSLFKERRYLKYFDEFSNLTKAKKSSYSMICFGFILFVILFFIGSFIFMDYLFHHKN